LKIAHHGSGTSTSEEMLGAVKPQFAVISTGYRNLYGHPKQQVLERLANKNVRTFRTDTSGIATFYLDGRTVTPQIQR
jgi:competence protein ComEC